MARDLSSKRVAIIATDYFEEAELLEPRKALEDAGVKVEVIAPEGGSIKGLQHVEPGEEVPVDKTLDDVNPEDYDGVVLPGGAINADQLRMNKKARSFVIANMEAGKPTAVICHAPWVLVSAGLVNGKKLTSYPTLQDDIINAGGNWVDEEVVIDGNLITSRKPDDLPAFNDALLGKLKEQ